MPYVDKDSRFELENLRTPKNAGELNYMITKLVNAYLKEEDFNYQRINDALGALEGAKLELYRRVAVPYENSKIALNGDVYDKLD